MNRLTHWNYKNTTLALDSCRPYLKLGQLEDIEEELGIDLITLFKALKNGIFTYEEYIPAEDLVIWKGQLYHKPLGSAFHIDIFIFDDYGTKWALTKEELENE